jgi:hypothetical protein
MYKTTNDGLPMPTANIAINKSRIKVYGKKSNVPTYYLKKGQEFQIELFNPTKDTICAKISLNGKPIAQGGLVLKPAQRVFLDRYIDVARKFKFDTYEVANTAESRKAIEDNGDFKVEFYKEQQPKDDWKPHIWIDYSREVWGGSNYGGNRGITGQGMNINTYNNTTSSNTDIFGQSLGLTNANDNSTPIATASAGNATLDFMNQDMLREVSPQKLKRSKSLKSKKSIETGRVEQGSRSDQSLTTVYMNWETHPFHTIEYKMLPVSQKVNTVQDTQVKRYCTNCGSKQKPNFKFCPSCGTRV